MRGNGAREAADRREAPILEALAKGPLYIEDIATLLNCTVNAAANFLRRSVVLGRVASVRFGLRSKWCLPSEEATLADQAKEERRKRLRAGEAIRKKRRAGRGKDWALQPGFKHRIIPASSVPPPVSGPSSVFAWAKEFVSCGKRGEL